MRKASAEQGAEGIPERRGTHLRLGSGDFGLTGSDSGCPTLWIGNGSAETAQDGSGNKLGREMKPASSVK